MKSTVLKRGSRKKQHLPEPLEHQGADPLPPVAPMDSPAAHLQRIQVNEQQHQMRRAAGERIAHGPTQETMDLTKKNYRLAKELVRARAKM